MSTRNLKASAPNQGARECSLKQRLAIEAHVARYLAPATHVIHEIQSEIVHLDLHVVPPAPEHPFWFLFTSGMSALAMSAPHHLCVPYAELSLMLPEYWPMDRRRWAREPRWFWPIRELLDLARYPHRNRTWMGEGHTIASADPPRPYHPSTRFAAMLLLPGTIGDEPTTIHGDVTTELLALCPLHADELAYKQSHGYFALLDRLATAGVSSLLDPDRPSAVA